MAGGNPCGGGCWAWVRKPKSFEALRKMREQSARGQMSAMLGRPAPTWTVAASVVGGYLLLVLATQGMLSGVRRPTAFVTISCVGVLTTVALIGITWVHHGSDPVSGARLSTIELSDDGQGRTTDLYAFLRQK